MTHVLNKGFGDMRMVSSNFIYCTFQLYLSSEIRSKFYAESKFEEFVIKEKEKKKPWNSRLREWRDGKMPNAQFQSNAKSLHT